METTKRRCRMISFRLSAEEYEHFKHCCLERGVHNVSELAREALHRYMTGDGNGNGSPLERQVETLQMQIEDLTLRVENLSRVRSAAC